MKRKILKKKSGAINGIFALFLIMLGFICMFYTYRKNLLQEMKNICEDSMTASTLAGGLIDIEEYGRIGTITIKDYGECYKQFKEGLSGNLRLDSSGNSEYTNFFKSPVEVTSFIIYNVNEKEGKVKVLQGTGSSLTNTYTALLGNEYAPDGTRIVKTSIYSEIEFDVVIWGSRIKRLTKGCCVDVSNE